MYVMYHFFDHYVFTTQQNWRDASDVGMLISYVNHIEKLFVEILSTIQY